MVPPHDGRRRTACRDTSFRTSLRTPDGSPPDTLRLVHSTTGSARAEVHSVCWIRVQHHRRVVLDPQLHVLRVRIHIEQAEARRVAVDPRAVSRPTSSASIARTRPPCVTITSASPPRGVNLPARHAAYRSEQSARMSAEYLPSRSPRDASSCLMSYASGSSPSLSHASGSSPSSCAVSVSRGQIPLTTEDLDVYAQHSRLIGAPTLNCEEPLIPRNG